MAKMIKNYNFNHGKCFSDLRNQRISSPITKKNNCNNNSINSIKMIHKSKKPINKNYVIIVLEGKF